MDKIFPKITLQTKQINLEELKEMFLQRRKDLGLNKDVLCESSNVWGKNPQKTNS